MGRLLPGPLYTWPETGETVMGGGVVVPVPPEAGGVPLVPDDEGGVVPVDGGVLVPVVGGVVPVEGGEGVPVAGGVVTVGGVCPPPVAGGLEGVPVEGGFEGAVVVPPPADPEERKEVGKTPAPQPVSA